MSRGTACLSNIILLLRNVASGVRFYREGLGLVIRSESENFARVLASENVTLDLKEAHSEAQCSAGYSPILTFKIDNMDEAIPRLLGLGAALDGAVRYNEYGKTAAVRSPDGHMIGLFEPARLPDRGDDALAASKAARSRIEQLGENTDTVL